MNESMLSIYGVVLLMALFTFSPLIASYIVSVRSKHPIPKRWLFVFVTSSIAYGSGLIVGTTISIFEPLSIIFGPMLEYDGHVTVARFLYSYKNYAALVAAVIAIVLGIVVPIRVAKAWSFLVDAWR